MEGPTVGVGAVAILSLAITALNYYLTHLRHRSERRRSEIAEDAEVASTFAKAGFAALQFEVDRLSREREQWALEREQWQREWDKWQADREQWQRDRNQWAFERDVLNQKVDALTGEVRLLRDELAKHDLPHPMPRLFKGGN